MDSLALTDPVSVLTHGVGALAFVIFAIPLLRRGAGSTGRVVALSVFSASAVFLLAASATFHALADGSIGRDVLQRIDHAGIFVLIAGTFTPIHAILFRGFMRWGLITFIWMIAAAGVSLKMVYFNQMPEWLGVAIYLAMGWMGALSMFALWRRDGFRACSMMVFAGVTYSLGAVCELVAWPTVVPGLLESHEVFHIAVILGLGLFWAFIYHIAGGHDFTGARSPDATLNSPTQKSAA